MINNRVVAKILLLVGGASILFIWFVSPDIAHSLTREDGAIENLSAIFWLCGFLISLICIFKLKGKQKIIAIVWMLLCFIFLGEETSWFQRIFNYSISSVEQISAQNEFNLHNLRPLQGGSWMKSFHLKNLLKSQNLFRVGFFGYFLLLPLVMYVRKIKYFMLKIGYKKPDILFVIVLLFVFGLSYSLVFLSPPKVVKSALAETREMLFSFVVLVYIAAYIWPKNKLDQFPPKLD